VQINARVAGRVCAYGRLAGVLTVGTYQGPKGGDDCGGVRAVILAADERGRRLE
jgi:hypothetical protein